MMCMNIWNAATFQGVNVDEKRIHAINVLADKLIKQGRTDVGAIQETKARLNQK